MGAVAVEEPSEVVAPDARVASIRRVSGGDIVGLLVSCLLVVVAFSPVVFFGHTLSGASRTYGTNGAAPFPGQPTIERIRTDPRPDLGASAWQSEPWAEVTHRAYADGEIPLWNPYQGAGAPLAGNMISEVFDPLLLAVNLHPTPLVWDISMIGAFVLGAAAAYLFARVLGLRVIPAVVTSAGFSLSGWFFLYSNNPFSRSYVFLPLLFLLVELVLRSRRLLPAFGLAVVVAGNIYVGMPEISFLVLGSTAVYAVARLVQERRRMPLRVSLVRLGGAGVLGLMLAAPLVLLFLQYEPLSFNVHKSGAGNGSQSDPQWGLLNWLVPFFAKPPESTFSPTVRSWFGVGVGICSLVAMSGRTETRRLHTWLFVAIGGAVLLKIYEFRVFDWVGRLPIVEQVVFPAFAPPVASFAFAVLAGIGVQVLHRRDLLLRRFLILLAGASVLLLAFVRTGDRWDVITSVPRDPAAALWGRGVLFAVLAVATIVAGSRYGRRWTAPLLAGLIVAELLLMAPFTIYAKRADPFRPPGWMPLVRTALAAEPDARVFALDGMLYPNTAGALGLQDVRALDALYVARYLRYVKTFIAPQIHDRFTATELPVVFRDNPMFDAFAARVVLSQSDLATSPSLRFVGTDGVSRVYENTNAYPRAWVVHRVHVVQGEDEAFTFLEAGAHRKDGVLVVAGFDPRREAVVERRGSNTEATLRSLQEGQAECTERNRDRATIERYTGNSVRLRVQAACPGLLVIPDTYFPGWKASVDGRDRTIYPTDGAFRGVLVPRGTSRVEIRYEPRPFKAGIILAAGGLAAFLLVGLVTRWRASSRATSSDQPGD